MNEVLLNGIIYFVFLSGLFGLCVGGVILKKKYKITNDDLKLAQLIIETVDFIISKSDVKVKGNISGICKYCIEAIDFVNTYETVTDIKRRKELIREKALYLLRYNNIRVDNDLAKTVDNMIDYMIDKV